MSDDLSPAPSTPPDPHPAEVAFAGYLRHEEDLDLDAEVEPLSFEAAKRHENGDTLADFLVIELHEGTDGLTGEAQLEQAQRCVERAIAGLQAAQAALEDESTRRLCRDAATAEDFAAYWQMLVWRRPTVALALLETARPAFVVALPPTVLQPLFEHTDQAIRLQALAAIERVRAAEPPAADASIESASTPTPRATRRHTR